MALDFIRRSELEGYKLPALHGHVKIKTYYAKSGNLAEVVEGDNIVTNALKDIFAANYLGSVNYGSLLPLWSKWYGGILCYGSTHTLDADNYFIPRDDVNHVIAHAGDTAPGSATIFQEDKKRGSPLEVTYTSNSVTQTWEWGSEAGNCAADEDIKAISLCHVDVGNAGTGCGSSAFQALTPIAEIDNLGGADTFLASPNSLFAQYDDYRGLWFHIAKENDYTYRNTLKTAGTSWITIILRRLPYAKVGLRDTLLADAATSVAYEIETSITFYNQPSYYFDYANKFLYLFTNISSGGRSHDGSNISYSVIDLSDLTSISESFHGTIHSDDGDFAPTCMEQVYDSYCPSVAINANINKVGNYFYFPTTSGAAWNNRITQDAFNINGYKIVNFTNPADYENSVFTGSAQRILRPYMGNNGILVGSGYVVNGLNGYPCANSYGDTGWNSQPLAINFATHAFNEPQKPSSYFVPIGGCAGANTLDRKIYANKFLNTTLYNLGSAVHKTTAKSMQISYTLTET